MIAAVALVGAINVLWLGPDKAAESEISPVRPAVTPVRPDATQVPTEAEREKWRGTMQRAPKPKNGCFSATYPETEWREVPCRTPPNKLFMPKRAGMTVAEIVGGAGVDFSAQATGQITEAEGSFDSVSGVASNSDVACPTQKTPAGMTPVCPATPSCTGQLANTYSLQLNTEPFRTSTCNTSPARLLQGMGAIGL